MMCFSKNALTFVVTAAIQMSFTNWIAAQAPNQGYSPQRQQAGQPNQNFGQPNQAAGQTQQIAQQNNGQLRQGNVQQPQGVGLPGQNFGQPVAADQQQDLEPAPNTVVLPQAPFPPMDAALQKYLDDVLGYWEKSTADIQRYSCSFKRWQFDPAQTKADFHYTYGEGIIRYAAPDKGLFKVETLMTYTTKDAAGAPQFKAFPNVYGEWWICDGKKVHNFDRTEKLVRQISLPPEMQGKAIYSSPLPFFFGVEAAKIKERYWIHPLPPPTGADGNQRNDLIHLEAFPKYQADAANYQKVQILIDQREFLPAAIIIFDRAWSENFPAREHFEFTERQKNFKFGDKLKETLFSQEFIPMEPPKEWKIIEDQVPSNQALPGDRVASPQQQQQSFPR
jgi:TIGR03009 family protein